MKLYPPIKEFYDNIAKRDHAIESVEHLLACKTQGFGNAIEPYIGWGMKGHNGIDWGVKEGTNVFASHDGRVIQSGGDQKAGIGVTIQDGEKKTIYWHLRAAIAPVGLYVKAGDIIGSSGNTGWSTGPHLHFGLKLVNSNGVVLDRNNGYDGAVDPSQYFVWYNMFELVQVIGSKDVWLVRDGKRSLVYNASALQLISDFASIKTITKGELDTYPDTGKVLASLDQE